MKKTVFGIIGTGMISGMFCDAVRNVPGASVASVLSRKKETGDGFVSRCFPDEERTRVRVFTDTEEFLRSGIDSVYVASPNFLHADYSIRAMEAGLDVLCEKPIASDRGEFEKMLSVSEKTGKVLLEAMRPAFDPGYDAVRDNLARLGKLRRVHLEYCQYSSRYDRFLAGEILRAFDPSYSNASVMDIGVYPIYVCAMLFGRPEGEILSRSFVFGNGMEGSGEVILPYGDMIAAVSYAKIFDSVNPSVVTGENGSVTIDKLSSPKLIKLLPRVGKEEIIYSSDTENNMCYEIEEFLKMRSDNSIAHRYAEFSRISMDIIDTIRRQNKIEFTKRSGS